MKPIFSLVAAFALAGILTSCTSEPKAVEPPKEVEAAATAPSPESEAAKAPAKTAVVPPEVNTLAKEVATEEKASFVVEISFKKGSSKITPSAKEKLTRLLKNVDNTSQLKSIQVVTWADQDYPSAQAKKLDDLQRKIAKNRNDEIKRFFQAADSSLNLDLHSMAERPGALKDLIGTSDSRIKKALEEAGIPTTNQIQKMPSKASKSIVMLVLKERAK